MALMCLLSGCGIFQFTADAKELSDAEEYLLQTGLSTQEIDALDRDVREYIAEDLKGSEGGQWRVNRDIQILTAAHSEPCSVAFYINVYAFVSDRVFRFYAVYESSTGIMPMGNDSLFLETGTRFTPLEYGGQLWYKKAGGENWVRGGRLNADSQTSGGAAFTGRQMGDFQRKMLVKGCVWCCAAVEENGEAKVTVEYTYEPPGENREAGIYILAAAVTIVVVLILRGRRDL